MPTLFYILVVFAGVGLCGFALVGLVRYFKNRPAKKPPAGPVDFNTVHLAEMEAIRRRRRRIWDEP